MSERAKTLAGVRKWNGLRYFLRGYDEKIGRPCENGASFTITIAEHLTLLSDAGKLLREVATEAANMETRVNSLSSRARGEFHRRRLIKEDVALQDSGCFGDGHVVRPRRRGYSNRRSRAGVGCG